MASGKQKKVITAIQTGFGFVAFDPETGLEVPWSKYDRDAVAQMRKAPWKGVDTETTGLVPSSIRVALTTKEIYGGYNAALRVRVVTVVYPHEGKLEKVAYDLDQLTIEQRIEVCAAALTGTFIAYNAGFDLFWLRTLAADVAPTRVLDVMLLARIMAPDIPVLLAEQAGTYDPDAPTSDMLARIAYESVMGGKSGWSLADVTRTLLGHVMPKGMQGPRNWTLEVLDQEHFHYATDDVDWMLKVLALLFKVDAPMDIPSGYRAAVRSNPEILKVEPQVMDLVYMRERGVPVNQEHARKYAAQEYSAAAKFALQLGKLSSHLIPFVTNFADPDKGLSAAAKIALAAAFRDRGVMVNVTSKAGSDMVGEKDLRLAGAMNTPEAKELFDAWVGVARSKKRAQMALDWAGFASRSADLRLHPLLGHGPVTGRLSSAEPNSQQAPRDEEFRAIIEAALGKKILAVDYSALDMRAGAALAVRAQLEMREAYDGTRECPTRVLAAIRYATDTPFKAATRALGVRLQAKLAELTKHEATSRGPGLNDRNYWAKLREMKEHITLVKFTVRLVEVREKGRLAGDTTYSALRNALLLGVDIHTYTAMGMADQDPDKEFGGLTSDELKLKQKHWKEVLGTKRQNGKISNLSLLYAMQALGLQTAAGKIYNVHWTLEESAAIIVAWLNAYPEIDLWHLWTELNPMRTIWAPDPDRGGKRLPTSIYRSITLGGRDLRAFGLNAALAYADQGSGADILGDVMHVLKTQYPEVFEMAVNQVHDELVLEIPEEREVELSDLVGKVMDECANVYLMPYGVPSACTPACAKVWVKD